MWSLTCVHLWHAYGWFDNNNFDPPLNTPYRGAKVIWKVFQTLLKNTSLSCLKPYSQRAELRKALWIWVRWSSFLCPVRRWVRRQIPRGSCPESGRIPGRIPGRIQWQTVANPSWTQSGARRVNLTFQTGRFPRLRKPDLNSSSVQVSEIVHSLVSSTTAW